MLSPDDLATVRAALLFWSEDMAPHGVEIMQPYFDAPDAEPLSADDVSRLRDQLVHSAIRYALYSSNTNQLASLNLFPTPGAADFSDAPDIRVATLLVGD